MGLDETQDKDGRDPPDRGQAGNGARPSGAENRTRRVVSVDEAANALEAAYAELSVRFAGSLNVQDREDLASEASLKMLRKSARGTLISTPTRYTVRVAIRMALRELENKARRPALLSDGEDAERFADGRADPARVVLARTDLAALLDEVRRLDDTERRVLVCVLADRDTPSIARELGCTQRTVYKRRRSAMTKLAAAVSAPDLATKVQRLLRRYVGGTASAHERLRAERLLEHEPVARAYVSELRRVHDVSGAILPVASASDQLADPSLIERVGSVVSRAKDRVLSGGDASEAIEASAAQLSVGGGARGAGAAGAGVAAKLAALGGAGKVALGCVTGGAAVSACIAAGVLPGPGLLADADDRGGSQQPDKVNVKQESSPQPVDVATGPSPVEHQEPLPAPDPQPSEPAEEEEPTPEPTPSEQTDYLAPSTPPVEREFGVAPAGTPVASSGSSSSSGSSGDGGVPADPVQREFGP